MYKRLLVIGFAALALTVASSAQATTFTLNSFDVSLKTTDPGLVLWEKDLLPEPTSFDLTTVGQSTSLMPLFRIGTDETALNLDDVVPAPIAVNFSFTQPTPAFGGSSGGLTGAAWLGTSFGYVAWDNPLLLSFGTSGLLSVTLTNETFGLPGWADVDVKFSLVRADVGTPEPASLLLIGTALAGMGFRKFRRAVAA
ncbi:MAG TPA: PEP-CTERM sorting domain-containing protein [Vicinamibacterales bacterium]|jgi:hypothetical protein